MSERITSGAYGLHIDFVADAANLPSQAPHRGIFDVEDNGGKVGRSDDVSECFDAHNQRQQRQR